MINEHKKNRLLFFILLSILINIFIVLAILLIKWSTDKSVFTQQTNEPTIECAPLPQALQQPPNEQPAPTTQSTPDDQEVRQERGPSVFGVTDQYQEIPEFTPGITDSLAADKSLSQEDQLAEELSEKEVVKDTTPPDTQKPTQEKNIESTQKDAIGDAMPMTLPETNTTQEHKEEIQKTTQKPKRRTKATRNNTGTGKKNASPAQRLTFADLARGFLDSQGTGKSWFNAQGKKEGTPGPEQLKTLSYTQKVMWHYQNSLRSYKYINPKGSTSINFTLTLNKNGTIKNIIITKKSDFDDFDQQVIKIIHDTAPFPPIPNHLNTEEFVFDLGCYTQVSEPTRVRFSYR